MRFSKPVLVLAPQSAGRQLEDISLGDAVNVYVEGNKEAEIDKSIVDVLVKQTSETAVKLSINFADTSAISQEITEPDVLVVDFSDPGVFVDKETGEPLGDASFTRKIKMGRQFTQSEFEEILEAAETAAQISVAVTIWEIIIIMAFKKVLFSMWILILTLQFFVYMATWQVRYPGTLHFLLYELKRIALGEFMDDLDIGN